MILIEEVDGAVLYCDGGFLQDKKHGGIGVHGYTYRAEEPKVGTGNPKAVPTINGYRYEAKDGNKVEIIHDGPKATVVEYIDVVAGSRGKGSNNEIELMALHEALTILANNPFIKKAAIYSDSRYAVQGCTTHIDKWIARNWLTTNGEPVKYRPLWEEVKALYDKLKPAIELKIEWVKGHNGHPGNEKADKLASKGIVLGAKNDPVPLRDVRPAQGYWKKQHEAPRLLQAPRWYFSTRDKNFVREDGSYVYYVGTHGTKDKEPDLPGKRYADNVLGVVRTKTPDPAMEVLRQSALQRDNREFGTVVVGSLDNIFSPKIYGELMEHEVRFMSEHKRRLDVFDSKDLPILEEVTPVGRSFRLANTWRYMDEKLDKVLAGDPTYRITEITDLIYEAPDAKKGLRKLKASVTQVTKFLDVKVEFNLEKASAEAKPFHAKVRLIVGSDILTRNQLAALGEDIQSVKVVSWRESDNVGRYATLVELKSGDVGLWARFEANFYYRQVE